MDHSGIELYIELMRKIKLRIKIISQFNTHELTTGLKEIDIESMSLQLRKILETISLCSLVMNQPKFQSQSNSCKKLWNPKIILAELEKINPDFYPKPVAHNGKDSDGHMRIIDLTDNFLNRDEFITVYGRLGDILHTDNPFGKKVDYIKFLSDIRTWTEKVIKLLNLHIIRLYGSKDFYLVYVYNAEDEYVHAIHYPAPF